MGGLNCSNCQCNKEQSENEELKLPNNENSPNIKENDEIHKKDLYLGNFIKDFKSKFLDKKQNNNLSKEVQITWSKKSKLFNVNLVFLLTSAAFISCFEL